MSEGVRAKGSETYGSVLLGEKKETAQEGQPAHHGGICREPQLRQDDPVQCVYRRQAEGGQLARCYGGAVEGRQAIREGPSSH